MSDLPSADVTPAAVSSAGRRRIVERGEGIDRHVVASWSRAVVVGVTTSPSRGPRIIRADLNASERLDPGEQDYSGRRFFEAPL
jgi:hypothetical protein